MVIGNLYPVKCSTQLLTNPTFEATKKWTSTLRNWGKIYGELQIMFEDRL